MIEKPETPIPLFIPCTMVIGGIIIVLLSFVTTDMVYNNWPTRLMLRIMAAAFLTSGGYILGRRQQDIDRYNLWQNNLAINRERRWQGQTVVDLTPLVEDPDFVAKRINKRDGDEQVDIFV